MIKKTMTVIETLEIHESLIDVYENHGFKGLDNKYILKQVGQKTVEELLQSRNKNVDVFIDLLNEAIENQNVDVTLMENEHKGSIEVVGLLPCPVRIPLLDSFVQIENINDVNHNLKAASEGLDWLKESVEKASDERDLADVYVSAGFDLFFEDDLMRKYKDMNVFKDAYKDRLYNSDFENDLISLRDPNHDYSMIGIVPAVFLVNTQILGDRPMPTSWSDLLDPIYEGGVSLPVSDFDLFNAIMLHLYKEFGLEAITRLRKQLISSMHPSQMVKSDRGRRVKPAISVMPYFFTKMALPGSVMQAVWPSDGAIVSPIFMLTKQSKEKELKPITDFFLSKEVGEILSHKGMFPSTHADVDNHLDGKPFKWVGWDYINNNNIGEILELCQTEFEKE